MCDVKERETEKETGQVGTEGERESKRERERNGEGDKGWGGADESL